MIKFRGQRGDKNFIGLGLSRENLTRLQQKHPILVNLEDLQMGPGQTFIFFGETEEEMVEELRTYTDLPPRSQWKGLAPEEDNTP